MIPRILEYKIKQDLFKGKAIILYGPRQCGKTTLIEKIASDSGFPFLYKNGDEPDTRELFSNITSTQLKSIIGNRKLLIIDEAQRIANIGLTIKLITDNIKEVQVIATGSSAFELAESIREPLTGRKYEHFLFPVSYEEMAIFIGKAEERRMLEQRLIYGYYPDIINHPGEERRLLNLLSDSYLYKDLFAYEKIKKPSLLQKLLKVLALQLGNEVSFNELSRLIGADKETVERYIDLLEKAYVIFTLPAFNRNLRTEIRKSRKIYFFDNGIRNAIISNFTAPGLRTDTGALWENFLISERRKVVSYYDWYGNSYFWRTMQQQEIDYIEDRDGRLTAFEFKWNPDTRERVPLTFAKAYPNSEFTVITPKTFELFVGKG
ncbi:MAG: ATP-binding protein [Bacteroidota bacterium]